MKRLLALVALPLACSSPAEKKPQPAATDKKADAARVDQKVEAPAEAPVTLTLWHTYRDAEQKALEAAVADWNASDAGKGTPVRLEANPAGARHSEPERRLAQCLGVHAPLSSLCGSASELFAGRHPDVLHLRGGVQELVAFPLLGV